MSHGIVRDGEERRHVARGQCRAPSGRSRSSGWAGTTCPGRGIRRRRGSRSAAPRASGTRHASARAPHWHVPRHYTRCATSEANPSSPCRATSRSAPPWSRRAVSRDRARRCADLDDIARLRATTRARTSSCSSRASSTPRRWSGLLEDVTRLEPGLHRSYIPRHKKGGSVEPLPDRRRRPRAPRPLPVAGLSGGFLSRPRPRGPPAVSRRRSARLRAVLLHRGGRPHRDITTTRRTTGAPATPCCSASSRTRRAAPVPAPHAPARSRARGPGGGDPAGIARRLQRRQRVPRGEPRGPGDRRVMLTLEYVTSREMGRAQRLFSDLKDAFSYFGVGRCGRRAAGPRARPDQSSRERTQSIP